MCKIEIFSFCWGLKFVRFDRFNHPFLQQSYFTFANVLLIILCCWDSALSIRKKYSWVLSLSSGVKWKIASWSTPEIILDMKQLINFEPFRGAIRTITVTGFVIFETETVPLRILWNIDGTEQGQFQSSCLRFRT